MDRHGRDPLDLMDEIEEVLGIDVVPDELADRRGQRLPGRLRPLGRAAASVLGRHARHDASTSADATARLDDPALREALGGRARRALRDDARAARRRGRAVRSRARARAASRRRCSSAARSPTSACSRSSSASSSSRRRPRPRRAASGAIEPDQAIRSPASSSRSRRTWTPTTATASRSCASARATSSAACTVDARAHRQARCGSRTRRCCMGQDREEVEEAFAGDVVGLFDPGIFRIGDTLSDEPATSPTPASRSSRRSTSCASRSRASRSARRSRRASTQLAQEGAVQLFTRAGSAASAAPILGAVGPLQFDVLQHRDGERVRWSSGSRRCRTASRAGRAAASTPRSSSTRSWSSWCGTARGVGSAVGERASYLQRMVERHPGLDLADRA